MALRFLGIWPNTPNDGSPTIWLDEGSGDLIIQSWKADDATLDECKEVGSVPGHSTDVPDHETVIRLPANLTGMEVRTDPAVAKLCAAAFEAVWEQAIPHAEFRPV